MTILAYFDMAEKGCNVTLTSVIQGDLPPLEESEGHDGMTLLDDVVMEPTGRSWEWVCSTPSIPPGRVYLEYYQSDTGPRCGLWWKPPTDDVATPEWRAASWKDKLWHLLRG
jgi:hypothetical protein